MIAVVVTRRAIERRWTGNPASPPGEAGPPCGRRRVLPWEAPPSATGRRLRKVTTYGKRRVLQWRLNPAGHKRCSSCKAQAASTIYRVYHNSRAPTTVQCRPQRGVRGAEEHRIRPALTQELDSA